MDTAILDDIKQVKREIIPNERLILFGSQARGDADEYSDWDLLILLNEKKKNFRDAYERYSYPFEELGIKHNILITALAISKEDWGRQKFSPFYKNVEQDGIDIL
jgi:predicted nucleotidyltransferase